MALLPRMRRATATLSRVSCRAAAPRWCSSEANKNNVEKTPVPMEGGNGASKYFVPAFITGTLALGFYLHEHDYMHRRESDGVLAATPEPLKYLTEAVRINVPGAYQKTK